MPPDDVVPPSPPASPPPPPPASLASAPTDAWKEYTPDATKSEADNAAAKAEHDKTKPAAEPAKSGDPPAAFAADKVVIPEGMAKDEKALGEFATIMNDDKLSPMERGQKLIDLQAGLIKQVSDANTKAWTDLQDQWTKEAKADKDIGGDKLAPTQQMISKVIDSLGPDSAKSFREALDLTGAGNNPAIIKGLAKLAAQLVEGGHVNGNPPKVKQSIQEEFFPNSPEMKG